MPLSGYVYCMKNSRHPGKYKFGFSATPQLRRLYIDRSMRGSVDIVFQQRLLFAYPVEQFLHGLFSPIRVKLSGSGGTEWFDPSRAPWLYILWVLFFIWRADEVCHFAQTLYPGMTPVFSFGGGLVSLLIAQNVMFVLLARVILLIIRILEILLIVGVFLGFLYVFSKSR